MARITLDKVTKSWGDTRVLQPMTLTIEDGEFVAVLGPSGCGKSTTLFLLAGLYAPTGGEIAFDGHNVNRIDARDRNVGIVFQSYALYPNLTVRQNIAFPLRFKNVPREEAARRVEEAASLVQISALLDRRPSQLSGGQQQRVALARALVKEPNILLLDEPLSNLDATLRITMRAELKNLQKRLKITTLIVTHDQIEAITMADRIICMNNGTIAQIGTPDDLYRRPNNLFVAGFIGTPPMNLLTGRRRASSCGSAMPGSTSMPVATARSPSGCAPRISPLPSQPKRGLKGRSPPSSRWGARFSTASTHPQAPSMRWNMARR